MKHLTLIVLATILTGLSVYALAQDLSLRGQVQAFNEIAGIKTTDNPILFNERLQEIKKFH